MALFGRRRTLETTTAAVPPVTITAASATQTLAGFRGLGASASRAASADDDEDMTADGDGNESGADEDVKPAKTKKAKKAKKAPDPAEDDNEGDLDGDDDDDEGDDESDEADMSKKGKASSARLRERARITTILSHPVAAANPDFALNLALNTNLGRKKICALLNSAPAAKPNTLTARMAGLANQSVPVQGPQQSKQDRMLANAEAIMSRVAISEKTIRKTG